MKKKAEWTGARRFHTPKEVGDNGGWLNIQDLGASSEPVLQ